MRKVKSIIDRFLAGISLIVLSPVMIIAAIGIKVSSKGTVFYKAKRISSVQCIWGLIKRIRLLQ